MMESSTTTVPPERPAGQRVSGMNCPACRMFIPISASQLLYDGGITCPHCGLTMTVDKSQSRQALDALKKVEEAARKVRETESFKR